MSNADHKAQSQKIIANCSAICLGEENTKERKERLAKVKDVPKKLKEMATRTVKFDFDKAERWLQQNKFNRPISKKNYESFGRKMYTGEFRTTSQGASIDRKGNLQDGQHRLFGVLHYYCLCEETGTTPKPVEIRITEGENSNFEFFDQGKNRTTADVLAIDEVDYHEEIAIALRLLWIRMNGKKVAGANKLSPYELRNFGQDHMEGLNKSAQFIMEFGKSEDSLPAKGFMSPGYIIAFHYLMVNAVDGTTTSANTFWEAVIENEADKTSPMYKLYKKFNKVRMTQDMKLSRDEMVLYCIQGMYSYLYEENVSWNKPTKDLFLGGLDGSLVPEGDE